ncbi:putative Alcohol dehydrogenase transcription factor Myb/SANT-like-containing protein 19 [Homarus americanus]|uniref:Putative Alcohol dehydrogenase transcription factor Myb/SANT-like-containing protein 19 n=1 Tax=Homarus americanus TaxID=6706 RepID=A0A8J5N2L4_HOMAM|nr:putative Alcohol dehydrogenase transcription factor Myb/SANT-like-containing protein 19 [Homarus americanus]
MSSGIGSSENEVFMAKKWSDTGTEMLISLYDENELLWNIRSAEYRNRVKKHEEFKRIGETINFDTNEVARKIHNLRNQFNQELKKLKQRKSASGADEVYASAGL